MFATDDKHPSDLLYGGHIDYIVKQAQKNGADPIVALKTATHHADKTDKSEFSVNLETARRYAVKVESVKAFFGKLFINCGSRKVLNFAVKNKLATLENSFNIEIFKIIDNNNIGKITRSNPPCRKILFAQ